MKRSPWLAPGAVLALACTSAPEPPPEPAEVSALAAEYARPSASLAPAATASVLERVQPTRSVLAALSGLRFVREVIIDATTATSDSTDLALDVQGSVLARAACPGAQGDADAGVQRGYLEVTIGVEASHVQRAFVGHARGCKFVTVSMGQRLTVIATMDFQIDLGADLKLGEPVDSLLIRATNVSGTIDGVALGLDQEVFSFRFGEDDSIETLIELAPLSLGLSGTCLLALQPDGAWVLGTRQGRWTCDGAGRTQCVLDEPA
jgi:hypothetical protein